MSHKITHYSLDFPVRQSVCGGERKANHGYGNS
jgi:hypothetical protein